MNKIHIPLIITILSLFSSCTSDSISDLIEVDQGDEPVTFVNDIQPIMANNCMPCHADPPQNAPIPLVTFEQVMIATQDASSNGVINRISRQPGQTGLMPQGGPRLPQNLIDLVIRWRDEGFLEKE